MKRTYKNQQIASNVNFFIGYEVEHTPANDKFTLFVVGTPTIEAIEAQIAEADKNEERFELLSHIYFGANHSFNSDNLTGWTDIILYFLNQNYWCTFEFDVKYINEIHETGLCEHRKFIPQISVKIPYLQLLNYNATIKIDDEDFAASNPGVWCLPLASLLNRKNFTCWDEYSHDVPLDGK